MPNNKIWLLKKTNTNKFVQHTLQTTVSQPDSYRINLDGFDGKMETNGLVPFR